jgi:hypothetical protein
MQQNNLEDLIRSALKPAAPPTQRHDVGAGIDALVKLAILAITAVSLVVIVTRVV